MTTSVKEVTRTTLYLDSAVHRAVKIAAIEDGVQMTEMVEQAVRELLERRKKARPK